MGSVFSCASTVMIAGEKTAVWMSCTVILCTIMCTMTLMLGLGIGIGYNYCYVDIATKYRYVPQQYIYPGSPRWPYREGPEEAQVPKGVLISLPPLTSPRTRPTTSITRPTILFSRTTTPFLPETSPPLLLRLQPTRTRFARPTRTSGKKRRSAIQTEHHSIQNVMKTNNTNKSNTKNHLSNKKELLTEGEIFKTKYSTRSLKLTNVTSKHVNKTLAMSMITDTQQINNETKYVNKPRTGVQFINITTRHDNQSKVNYSVSALIELENRTHSSIIDLIKPINTSQLINLTTKYEFRSLITGVTEAIGFSRLPKIKSEYASKDSGMDFIELIAGSQINATPKYKNRASGLGISKPSSGSQLTKARSKYETLPTMVDTKTVTGSELLNSTAKYETQSTVTGVNNPLIGSRLIHIKTKHGNQSSAKGILKSITDPQFINVRAKYKSQYSSMDVIKPMTGSELISLLSQLSVNLNNYGLQVAACRNYTLHIFVT